MPSNTVSFARLGIGVAALAAVLVLGGVLVNNGSTRNIAGGAPPSTPVATPTPIVSAPAVPSKLSSVRSAPCSATDPSTTCLPPGTYQLSGGPGVWPVMVTVSVPGGWFEWNAAIGWDALIVDGDSQDRDSGWGIQFSTVSDVARDPCDGAKGTIPAAQVSSPEKLAAAIAAWPGTTSSTPKPITIDGRPGLELTVARVSEAAGCGYGTSWVSASHEVVDAYPFVYGKRYPMTMRIVDTGHGLLVVRLMDFQTTSPYELGSGLTDTPTRHAADLPGLHSIADSIRLTDQPPSN